MLRLFYVTVFTAACAARPTTTLDAAPDTSLGDQPTVADVTSPRDVGVDATPAIERERNVFTFHVNRARHGWYAREPSLSPERVRRGFGPVWASAPFESLSLGGRSYAPHVYATPLYLDGVTLTGGAHRGRTVRVVIVATSNADVYALAVATIDGGAPIPPGSVLWRTRVTTAGLAALDGTLPMGVLSTPVIDTNVTPPVLYVASMDATHGWQVIALDVTSGERTHPTALTIHQASLDPVNRNGPAVFAAPQFASQRGALALSHDGAMLYVPFGTYAYAAPGWMVAIDTRAWRVAHAFSSAPSRATTSVGGMWASGGPALDDEGRLYMTTGNDALTQQAAPGVWGSSLLRWRADLSLDGTYTPFNYCVLDAQNMDLAGSGPLVLPPIVGARTPTLVAFGGKQGVMYLLDRARLPGMLTARPECHTDAARDPSLLNPAPQAQWGTRGPLLVFPPYTERYGQVDHARMRTTPALWQNERDETFLFVSGTSRAREEDTTPIPPALARLRVVAPTDAPAYLAIDAREERTTLMNPGSAIVTSNARRDPVVWVLDANIARSTPLVGDNVGRPRLYAFDGITLARLWESPVGALEVGGKYSSPAVGRGLVFVGTDRLRAFATRDHGSAARCNLSTPFVDGFDTDEPGTTPGRAWQLSPAPARSAVRVSTDAEGEGDRSARYLILTNNASDGPVTLTAATPPLDASACTEVSVEMSVIAFSMEQGEMDAAWLDVRGNGWDWITLEQVFPSRYFTENPSCRAGQQSTGCTRWTPLRYVLPPAIVGRDLQLRLRARMHTSASDAMGLDQVTLSGR